VPCQNPPAFRAWDRVDAFVSGPDALHASFAIYRALDATIAQNQQRKTRRLTLPVLGIGGAHSLGEQVADTMKLAADDAQTLVIPGCAHWVAEETPEETLAALTAFLAPYRGRCRNACDDRLSRGTAGATRSYSCQPPRHGPRGYWMASRPGPAGLGRAIERGHAQTLETRSSSGAT